MGKTFRRDSSFRPKGGKDFKRFKKSKKFKNWDDKPHKFHPTEDPTKEVETEDNFTEQ